MGRLIRYPIAFILAVVVAELLGAIFQVQGTIRQQFAPLGIEIPLAEQLSWTLHDIAGFYNEPPLPLYPILLAIGFLIAFVAAAWISRLMPRLRTLVFTVAGAAAIFTIFALAKPVFWGVTPIYGARDALGLGLQCLAGGVAGLVFALITARRG